jgi:hypothetical protein
MTTLNIADEMGGMGPAAIKCIIVPDKRGSLARLSIDTTHLPPCPIGRRRLGKDLGQHYSSSECRILAKWFIWTQ